jgi:uncharacterized DUF497 family protein
LSYVILRVIFRDEPKRRANLAKHRLDLADAEKVFAGPIVLFEDNRPDYGEQCMIGIGLLDNLVVLIVHVKNAIREELAEYAISKKRGTSAR